MSKLISLWRQTYFTEVLLLIVLLFLIPYSIKRRKGYPQLKLLPIYLMLFVGLQLANYLAFTIPTGTAYRNKILHALNIYGNYFISMIEFLSFMLFFIHISRLKSIKHVLVFLTYLTLATFGFVGVIQLVFSNSLTDETINDLYLLQLFSFIISCSLYYFDLFKSLPVKKLTSQPNFWIASGLSFYSLCTLPYSLLIEYFRKTSYEIYLNLYSIIYLLYIVLFIMIIKAYRCKGESAIS